MLYIGFIVIVTYSFQDVPCISNRYLIPVWANLKHTRTMGHLLLRVVSINSNIFLAYIARNRFANDLRGCSHSWYNLALLHHAHKKNWSGPRLGTIWRALGNFESRRTWDRRGVRKQISVHIQIFVVST